MKNIKIALMACYAIQLIYIPLILYMVIAKNIAFGSAIVAFINIFVCSVIFVNIFSRNLKEVNLEIYEEVSSEKTYRDFGYTNNAKSAWFAFSASNVGDSDEVKQVKKCLRLYYLLLLGVFLFFVFALVLSMFLYYV